MDQERPQSSWGESGAEADYQRDVTADRESPWRPPVKPKGSNKPPEGPPEGPKAPKSIDPGPVQDIHVDKQDLKDRLPHLSALVEKLDAIEFEEFGAESAAFKGDKNAVIEIAERMKEAMLFRAIVENWSEETLLDQYRTVMQDLFTECADRPWIQKGWGQVQRGWHAVFKRENFSIPNDRLNDHLNDRQLKITDRLKLNRALIVVENTYLGSGITHSGDICLEMDLDGSGCSDWEDENDLEEDQLEFVRETAIPFYRSFIINRGIVENANQEELETAYRGILNRLYKQCQIPGEW